MDQNNDKIDILLWKEEIKDVILMDKIYKFTNLRFKNQPNVN